MKILIAFVAAFVAVGAVFLAPAVEGQVTSGLEEHRFDFVPGGVWVHPTTGASMLTYACTASNRLYPWSHLEDSTVLLDVKVMLRGSGYGQRHGADYHSYRFSPQQRQECDLRKGIDVVTFELRNRAGQPVTVDWSDPAFQRSFIVARAYPAGNTGFKVNARGWGQSFPGTRRVNNRPVTGQSLRELIADPGEALEDLGF